jgi:hypothetical protein
VNTERPVLKAVLEQAFTSGTTNDGTSVGYGFGWVTNVFAYLNERYREREKLLALGGADLASLGLLKMQSPTIARLSLGL